VCSICDGEGVIEVRGKNGVEERECRCVVRTAKAKLTRVGVEVRNSGLTAPVSFNFDDDRKRAGR